MKLTRDCEARPVFGVGSSGASTDEARFFEPGSIVSEEWRSAERGRRMVAKLRRRDRLTVARTVINGFALFGIVVTAICIPVIFEFSRSSKAVGLDVLEYSIDWWLMLSLLMIPMVAFVGGLAVLRPTLQGGEEWRDRNRRAASYYLEPRESLGQGNFDRSSARASASRFRRSDSRSQYLILNFLQYS